MIHYLDSSALAKRYVAEAGSAKVRHLVERSTVATSRITYAELCAALARALRDARLTKASFSSILQTLDRDFTTFTLVEVRPAVVERVRDLVMAAPLRAYDAIQLASALTLHDRGIAMTFWAGDKALLDAASACGIRAKSPG